MDKIIFYVIAAFIAAMIFSSSNEKKLYWVFIALLLFPRTIVFSQSLPFVCFPVLILGVLFVDFLIHIKKTYASFKQFPLRVPLIIFFFCLLGIGLFDFRITIYQGIYKTFYYLLENFGPVFFAYYCVKTLNGVSHAFDVILRLLFICAVYGICNKIIGVNLYTSFISKTFDTIDFGNYYTITGNSRFRISSFTWNPIYYGLIVALGVLVSVFYLTAIKPKGIKKLFCITTLILLLVNLILVNSRAPIISLFAGLGIYYLFGLQLNSRIKIVLIVGGVFASVIFFFPSKLKLLASTFNSVTSTTTDVQGSSISMREMQLKNSLKEFDKSPVFGNGFDYIEQELGYKGEFAKHDIVTRHFKGFESYAFKLLIEQGIMGIIGNLVFFSYLFIYLLTVKNKLNQTGRRYVFFSLGLLVCFLLFIFSSGDLYSFSFFMLLLGIQLGAIKLCLKAEEEKEAGGKNRGFTKNVIPA